MRGPQPQAERQKNLQSSRCVFTPQPCLLKQMLLLFPGQLSGLLWLRFPFLCVAVFKHIYLTARSSAATAAVAVEGCRGALQADVLPQVAVCPCRKLSGAERSTSWQLFILHKDTFFFIQIYFESALSFCTVELER